MCWQLLKVHCSAPMCAQKDFFFLNSKLGRAADVNQTIDCSLIKKELKSPGVIKKIFQNFPGPGWS